MQKVVLTLETGDEEFKLADLMKEVQDFLEKKDFEIIDCAKIKKTQKREKDV